MFLVSKKNLIPEIVKFGYQQTHTRIIPLWEWISSSPCKFEFDGEINWLKFRIQNSRTIKAIIIAKSSSIKFAKRKSNATEEDSSIIDLRVPLQKRKNKIKHFKMCNPRHFIEVVIQNHCESNSVILNVQQHKLIERKTKRQRIRAIQKRSNLLKIWSRTKLLIIFLLLSLK